LMVLLVVKLHDLPRDERLESIIGVWEIRESLSGDASQSCPPQA
jgi:hypothetical protein